MAYKILIADSHQPSIDFIRSCFPSDSYSINIVQDGKDVIPAVTTDIPDLLILETVLPGIDGIEICMELRQMKACDGMLIVFYTERNEDYSHIAGLNAGADDYIIKPIKAGVFKSRMQALLKRKNIKEDKVVEGVHHKGLHIDRERYLIIKDGKEILLPRKEFELLALLYTSPRKVFTRKDISFKIWGQEMSPSNRTIDVHVRKLREKIGNRSIKTVKGIGYSLEI